MTTITDVTQAHRYEAHDDDGELLGFLDYEAAEQTVALIHTETLPQARGLGLGSELVSHALQDARTRGLRVRPVCAFVARYLAHHPDEGDLTAD